MITYEQCLGVDWGSKRIGLAIGSTENKLASPLSVVASLSDLLEVIKSEKIDRLVLGKPIHAHSPEKSLNSEFEAFLKALEAQSQVPVELVDERFSSQLADSLGVLSKRVGERDMVAAMVILQSYFDSLDNSL